jgi:hypothetical protein
MTGISGNLEVRAAARNRIARQVQADRHVRRHARRGLLMELITAAAPISPSASVE